MPIKQDLPQNFFNQATLVDANYSFSLFDRNVPNSRVYVEKYVAKKGEYNFTPIGTASASHPDAYLFEESNFIDIGGGMVTFERKYAVVPESHEELVTVPVRTGRVSGVAGTEFSTQNFLGGELEDGQQRLSVNGEEDTVFVRNSKSYDIDAIKKTSYYLKKEGIDSDPKTSNSSEIINLQPELLKYYNVQYYNWYNGSSQTTVTRRTLGSVFDNDTVFRRVNEGRYLGNIFVVNEYRLLNKTITTYGAIVSEAEIIT
jgi:hypothetical protein